ncbi:MAG: MSMEG_0568 family radical SAM protein [Desulfomonile tiedjei]|uniref:tRNA carboxymethyluridine synthase n=1 Tax=Desulfomonile tiedjei TaxID=2358 RepID=A0A9D6V5R9_9BACT|nr:MSMEG_0568 family radical SAM protein [Desulfomonile tiedjei]
MLAHTITEIQSLGVQVAIDSPNRKVGAGPAEGGTIILDGIPAHVPFSGNFVSRSPYALRSLDGESWLVKDGDFIWPATMKPRPKFYDYSTKDQVPYSSIALFHGKDCVASTVRQTCVYWNSEKRCQFCGIELSLSTAQTTRLKTPSQLAEVVRKAMELDSVSHVVLTTGAVLQSGKEIDYLGSCAKAIKRVCDLTIHAQFLPPDDARKLYELKKAGVDTVGIHIESFDMGVLARLAPAKCATGIERYEKAWNWAVDVFGFNQVSSFVLVGLGEQEDSVVKGSEFLADRGVYPFVVPFRPIPGSLMQDCGTPSHETMKRLYSTIAGILSKRDLSAARSLAGCVKCGACSALQAYEREAGKEFICRRTTTEDELSVALEIRKDVFVREQGLFDTSDLDENDSLSTHIIVKCDNQVVGTVRVFPENDGLNHWVGGRLAVRKKHRDNHVGTLLVREAMRYVKNRGCTRFTAHIQEQNVRYFSLLGWKAVGPVEMYHGKAHRLMEADLNKI